MNQDETRGLTSAAGDSSETGGGFFPPVWRTMTRPGDLELQALLLKQLAAAPTASIRQQTGPLFLNAMPFDPKQIYRILLQHMSDVRTRRFLARVLFEPEKGFILASTFRGNGAEEHRGADEPFDRSMLGDLRFLFTDDEGCLVRNSVFHHQIREGTTRVTIHGVNATPMTILRNTLEILAGHQLWPQVMEVRRTLDMDQEIRSLYRLELHYPRVIEASRLDSLHADFHRYLQVQLKAMSIFDMIGPSMVGPSSSHTAGANRIGRIARNILLGLVEAGRVNLISEVRVELLGSFRDTGVGHRTPQALFGGLCGLSADDPLSVAARDQDQLILGERRVRFGGFRAGSLEQDKLYARDGSSNIARIIATTDQGLISIVGFSIGGGNVEVRYIGERLSTPITGKEDVLVDGTRVLRPGEGEALPLIRGLEPQAPSSGSLGSLAFDTMEEMLVALQDSGKPLIQLVLESETAISGLAPGEIRQKALRMWGIMEAAVRLGLEDQTSSLFNLTGWDSGLMKDSLSRHRIFDNISGRAVMYATAVSEHNARSGVVVACPTAGACGILPGVLYACRELDRTSEQDILDGLLVAGFMGMIFFDDVTTAGADFGCQAEVGAAAAMAAAALAQIQGGTPEAVVHGFILAIKNAMGLICDPVAGLVEVPCVKRNGIYASMAIAAAQMALAGVRSQISPDEVILAVREVGARLHRDYRETAGGGLAKTRDGKMVERRFQEEAASFLKRD